MSEVWKWVVGYEGLYQVSSAGKVKSVDRQVTYKDGRVCFRNGVTLSPGRHKVGYPYVTLYKHGKGKSYTIHKLVVLAFVGPVPKGLEICHNDGNPENCSLENLRIDTRPSNIRDRVKHYGGQNGANNHQAKLSEDQVKSIRSDNRKLSEIAKDYGMAQSTISQIRSKKRWAHVD